MSPAATRRYVVGFESWTMYETIVLAGNEHEAIVKGKALYDLNGLADFYVSETGAEPWHAQYLDDKVQL
ncbi:hypothetical protein IVB36_01395 [Bradyrhizobium sp. 35]|uniref:hypothetical protein n=1 Tax=Bradyrhizobium sp. 35 TaxID=2782670 RepID=UPI001FFAA867|nr:hypothetical protein [Bradyrhizobium sp. 35]MCK1449601.1 hypothetical protein [Bradyrhizobium sp. 35]